VVPGNLGLSSPVGDSWESTLVAESVELINLVCNINAPGA
jgi:hypothetical protein